jgi:phospholipid N-methyltransferase
MDYTTVSRDRWHDHWLFLNHFRKNPRSVGAIAPSSQRLARAMLAGVPVARGDRLVELGPGTGAITAEIARQIPADGRCLAIDIDPIFSAKVGARWPEITSVCDRAERLVEIARSHDFLPVNHIVSGLPFASLPMSSTRAIVEAIAESLAAGGTFTTFQYVHAYALPPAVTVRRLLSRAMGSSPARTVVLGNLPPALVLRWRKHR